MIKGEKITIDGISYIIEMIDTPETHEENGHKNLANAMRETGRTFSGAVRRVKGKKYYWINVYKNGIINITKNSIC